MTFENLPTTANDPLEPETINVYPFNIEIFSETLFECDRSMPEGSDFRPSSMLLSDDEIKTIGRFVSCVGEEHFRTITSPTGIDNGQLVTVKTRCCGDTIESVLDLFREEVTAGNVVYLYMVSRVSAVIGGLDENTFVPNGEPLVSKTVYKARYGIL